MIYIHIAFCLTDFSLRAQVRALRRWRLHCEAVALARRHAASAAAHRLRRLLCAWHAALVRVRRQRATLALVADRVATVRARRAWGVWRLWYARRAAMRALLIRIVRRCVKNKNEVGN